MVNWLMMVVTLDFVVVSPSVEAFNIMLEVGIMFLFPRKITVVMWWCMNSCVDFVSHNWDHMMLITRRLILVVAVIGIGVVTAMVVMVFDNMFNWVSIVWVEMVTVVFDRV